MGGGEYWAWNDYVQYFKKLFYVLFRHASVSRTYPSQSGGKGHYSSYIFLATTCSKVYGTKVYGSIFFLFEVYPTCVSSKRCVFIISRANSYVGGRRKNCKLSKEEKKKRHLRRPPRGLLLLNKESHSGFYQSESKTAMFWAWTIWSKGRFLYFTRLY